MVFGASAEKSTESLILKQKMRVLEEQVELLKLSIGDSMNERIEKLETTVDFLTTQVEKLIKEQEKYAQNFEVWALKTFQSLLYVLGDCRSHSTCREFEA